MIVSFKNDDIFVTNEKQENYVIKKKYIGGTLIQNYFVYLADVYDFFINSYTTLEEALQDIEKGYI